MFAASARCASSHLPAALIRLWLIALTKITPKKCFNKYRLYLQWNNARVRVQPHTYLNSYTKYEHASVFCSFSRSYFNCIFSLFNYQHKIKGKKLKQILLHNELLFEYTLYVRKARRCTQSDSWFIIFIVLW